MVWNNLMRLRTPGSNFFFCHTVLIIQCLFRANIILLNVSGSSGFAQRKPSSPLLFSLEAFRSDRRTSRRGHSEDRGAPAAHTLQRIDVVIALTRQASPLYVIVFQHLGRDRMICNFRLRWLLMIQPREEDVVLLDTCLEPSHYSPNEYSPLRTAWEPVDLAEASDERLHAASVSGVEAEACGMMKIPWGGNLHPAVAAAAPAESIDQ